MMLDPTQSHQHHWNNSSSIYCQSSNRRRLEYSLSCNPDLNKLPRLQVVAVSGCSIILPSIGQDLNMQQDSLQWVPSAFALSSVCRVLLLRIHDARFVTHLQELFLPSVRETRGSTRPEAHLPHWKRMDVYFRTCVRLCKNCKSTACSQGLSRRRRRGIHNCLCKRFKESDSSFSINSFTLHVLDGYSRTVLSTWIDPAHRVRDICRWRPVRRWNWPRYWRSPDAVDQASPRI